MTIIFDAATEPWRQWPLAAVPIALLFYAGWLWIRDARRRVVLGLLGAAAITGALLVGLTLWDHLRIWRAVENATELTVVEGPISGHSIETRRRKASIGWASDTWEQFTVGGRAFGFFRGGYPSHASFTNRDPNPNLIADGTPARITYWIDPAYGDDARIVKLELGARQPALPGFEAFRARFARAVAADDRPMVRSLTAFPFLFAGTQLEPSQFDTLWDGLLSPQPIRDCLASAEPRVEGRGMVMFCGAYIFYFGRMQPGWRLVAFVADGEATAG